MRVIRLCLNYLRQLILFFPQRIRSNVSFDIQRLSVMEVTRQKEGDFCNADDLSDPDVSHKETVNDFREYSSKDAQSQGRGTQRSESGDYCRDTSAGVVPNEEGAFSGQVAGGDNLDDSGQPPDKCHPDRNNTDIRNPAHVFHYLDKREDGANGSSVYCPPTTDECPQQSSAAENCCCVECGVTFANIDLLLKHVQRHEAEQYGSDDIYQGAEEDPADGAEAAGDRGFEGTSLDNAAGYNEEGDATCMECGEVFDNVGALLRHVEVHEITQSRQKRDVRHGESIECPVCHQAFADERLMSEHLKRHNSRGGMTSLVKFSKPVGDGPSSRDGPKADFNVYTYRRCDQNGSSVGNKTAHLCLVCGDVFRKLTSLDTHYQVHRGVAQLVDYKCSICGKVFSKENNLNTHMRLHNQDRPYKCGLCGKRFTQSSHLRQHELIHTQVRPFSCRFCPKMFRQSSHLHMHERIHTGMRPYKCRLCDKAFMQSSHLRIHERTHSRVRPYNCRFCNATFIQSAHMRLHEKRHLGEASGQVSGTQQSPTGNQNGADSESVQTR